MQIATVHKLQRAWDSLIKALQFIWRHAFVLASFGITIHGISEGRTPIVEGAILVFAISTFLDWIKMKIKLKHFNANSTYQQSSSITSFTQANYWNSSIVGTPAYLSNLGHSH